MKQEIIQHINQLDREEDSFAQHIYQDEYRTREIRPSDDESIRKIARSAFEEFGAPLTGSVYVTQKWNIHLRSFKGKMQNTGSSRMRMAKY